MAPLPNRRPEQAAHPPAPLTEREPVAPPTGRGTVSKLPKQAVSPPPARLTGRGAVFAMAGIYLIGLLLAAWLGWAVLAGLAFVAGCVLAARYAASTALLTVVVSPPLLFLGAVILVSAMTGPGGLFMSIVVGSVVTLASVALWLAVGMVLTVIIAMFRGLPGCIRDLRRDLRASRRRRSGRPSRVRTLTGR